MSKVSGKVLITEEDLIPFVKTDFISIGWRLLVYFIFISLIPVFIVGFSALQKGQFVLENEIGNRFESFASLKLSQLSYWMNQNREHFSELLVSHEDLQSRIEVMLSEKTEASRAPVRRELKRLLRYSPEFTEYFLMDPQTGRVLVSSESINEGFSKADDNYFIVGKEKLFPGEFYFSSDLNEIRMTMGQPLFGESNNLLAVIGVHINLDTFYHFLDDRTGLGRTGEIYMVSRFYKTMPPGIVSEKDLISEKALYTLGVDRAFQGQKGIDTYSNYAGNEVIGFYQYVPEFGTAFLVEQDKNEVFEPVFKNRTNLIWVLLITLLADALLAFIISRNITKPLGVLADNAERIKKGDYDLVSELATSDEFGNLARSLNKMAESLLMSLSETKNIINTMPNALFILDVNGKITSANTSASELTDFVDDQLIGKHFTELIRPQDDDSPEKAGFDLDEIQRSQLVVNKQVKCFTHSHQYIPVSLSASVLTDKHEKQIGYIVILQDLRKLREYAQKRLQAITPLLHRMSLGDFSQHFDIPGGDDEFSELLLSLDLMSSNLRELIEENQNKTSQVEHSKYKIETEKAKLEAFMKSIGEAIVAIDLEGNIIMINTAAEKMFKQPFVYVSGKLFEDIYHFENEKGEPLRLNNFPIQDVLNSKQQIYLRTLFGDKENGQIPFATTVSPILFGDTVLGVIGTFRDITKEVEVDKAKSEFVSLASHQLRTPLAGLNWLLQEVVRKGQLDEIQSEYLQDALMSTQRMVHLVGDLLNVSRLETGIINVESNDEDLSKLINLLVKEASVVALDKHIKIDFNNPDMPVIASYDKDLIGQVITNLLSNAINYSDPNTTIQISAGSDDKGIFFTVKDQGIGISKEDQEKLFTKFFRSKDAARYSTTGSGLGLYIIKKVLTVCEGSIECDSDVGKGTAFTVRLPFKGPTIKGDGDKKLIEQKLRSKVDSV